jgi:hypothetical protein
MSVNYKISIHDYFHTHSIRCHFYRMFKNVKICVVFLYSHIGVKEGTGSKTKLGEVA